MSAHVVPPESGPVLGLLDTHVESFFAHLRAEGYAGRTLKKKRSVIKSFARWTRRRSIAVEDLDESHAARYASRSERRKARAAFENATLRLLIRFLRLDGGVPSSVALNNVPPAEALLRDYVNYLRGDRGLAENSICVYAPYIRRFLNEQFGGCTGPEQFDAPKVHAFVTEQIQGRSREYGRLLGSALRSFLRFLYARERTPTDLSFAVPAVRRWRQATVPAFLSCEQVEQVLSMTDRSTACGRRDYAVLLLLARLGLRASEVVAMELDDLRWRSAEIVIRGKGGRRDRMPLLSDIGEALASYLRKDRGHSPTRRVFLRMWAPRRGLAGPAAVGHIVRHALARAQISRSGRGAAHLFRHSLATRMIRHGASIPEIAEVLRHRSQGSSEIYAKVAFETLRAVARRWPATGGAR